MKPERKDPCIPRAALMIASITASVAGAQTWRGITAEQRDAVRQAENSRSSQDELAPIHTYTDQTGLPTSIIGTANNNSGITFPTEKEQSYSGGLTRSVRRRNFWPSTYYLGEVISRLLPPMENQKLNPDVHGSHSINGTTLARWDSENVERELNCYPSADVDQVDEVLYSQQLENRPITGTVEVTKKPKLPSVAISNVIDSSQLGKNRTLKQQCESNALPCFNYVDNGKANLTQFQVENNGTSLLTWKQFRNYTDPNSKFSHEFANSIFGIWKCQRNNSYSKIMSVVLSNDANFFNRG